MRFAFYIDFGTQAILNDVLTGAMAESPCGTLRTIAAPQQFGRLWGTADIGQSWGRMPRS
jgi:hypothetical protein